MHRSALLVAMTLSATSAVPAGLDDLRWQNRVLLLVAPSETAPLVAAQRRAFREAASGNAERDLVLVEAIGDGRDATAIRRRFSLGRDASRAILIGKDGGAKLSSAEPIPAARLFETIDAMPMRRAERARAAR